MLNFLLRLLLGTIIGWLASLILHPDGHMGPWQDIGIGAVGAFIAGIAFTPHLGINPITQGNYSFPALLGSLLGALLMLGAVKLFSRLGKRAAYPTDRGDYHV
jgi:uncharacterized membrane protein YeaQ/YmgE (transglycosylase-associated protein family)